MFWLNVTNCSNYKTYSSIKANHWKELICSQHNPKCHLLGRQCPNNCSNLCSCNNSNSSKSRVQFWRTSPWEGLAVQLPRKWVRTTPFWCPICLPKRQHNRKVQLCQDGTGTTTTMLAIERFFLIILWFFNPTILQNWSGNRYFSHHGYQTDDEYWLIEILFLMR